MNSQKADKAFVNGTVYTVDRQRPFAEAVTVTDGKISFVGSREDAEKHIGQMTEIVDMKGGMLFPGMIDSHIHPPGNMFYQLFDMDFNKVKTIEEVNRILESFIASHPDEPVYYGSGLNLALFREGKEAEKGPCKERLDTFCSDKPIVINSKDMHSIWANSKAFELSGITADTPDPEGGRIERVDETGEPWGITREKPAGEMLMKQEFTNEQTKEAILAFQEMLHSLGITGIFSMPGIIDVTKEMYELAQEGRLKLRVSGAYYAWPEELTGKSVAEQLAEAVEWKDTMTDAPDLFKITTLKYNGDGVVEGLTAALKEPYEEASGKPSDYHGEFIFSEEDMQFMSEEGNRSGLQIHVHSIGDLSTKKVLDTYEKTRADGIIGDYRNTITHLEVVDEADIPRFAELDVIAAAQPFWFMKDPDAFFTHELPFLGRERAEHEYPMKAFFDQGVIVTSSSDHGVTEVPYPFIAIENGVTRNLTTAEVFDGVEDIRDMDDPRYLLNPSERVSVADMVETFTINGAYQGFREKEIGSIEEGKFADFVLVDQNIFECNPVDIEKTKVMMTVFNGDIVFESQRRS